MAASALWRINKRPNPIAPVLFTALHDKGAHERDDRVRLEAIAALAEIGRADPDAVVPRLVQEFESPDEDLYGPASLVLSDIGPAAKKAVPVVMRVFRANKDLKPADSNGFAYRERTAGFVLRAIGEESVPPLVAALEDDDAKLRDWAAWVFRGMGPAAKGAVPALVRAAQDRDAALRDHAMAALEGIGPAARAAVPVLVVAVQQEKSSELRAQAAQALGTIVADRNAADEANPALRTAADDPDEVVRACARRALAQIEARLTE